MIYFTTMDMNIQNGYRRPGKTTEKLCTYNEGMSHSKCKYESTKTYISTMYLNPITKESSYMCARDWFCFR